MTGFLRSFLADDSGATAIEYGLIAALISVVAIIALKNVGSSLNQTFSNVGGQLGGT
ncbi:MAG: Flp family type IVb pilin [Alphaproteobacteria bacterium]